MSRAFFVILCLCLLGPREHSRRSSRPSGRCPRPIRCESLCRSYLHAAANVVKDFETLQLSAPEKAMHQAANGLARQMHVEGEVEVVNNVHDKGEIRPYVQKVVNMMADNRLRNVSKAFDKLLAMRGKKVDARGVEVQGELDLAGQRMADVVWKGIGMSDDDVADMCADAQDRMMSANGAEAAAATDYAGWQIVMHLGLLPYYNNLLAEYLASYTNTLQLIDCQYFTQCKILQISLDRKSVV